MPQLSTMPAWLYEDDGRNPSDSVYSVESIDDSDIPKCSFMKDPEHDTDDLESQGPGLGDESEQSDGSEEWEDVQRFEAERHDTSGGAAVLSPARAGELHR